MGYCLDAVRGFFSSSLPAKRGNWGNWANERGDFPFPYKFFHTIFIFFAELLINAMLNQYYSLIFWQNTNHTISICKFLKLFLIFSVNEVHYPALDERTSSDELWFNCQRELNVEEMKNLSTRCGSRRIVVCVHLNNQCKLYTVQVEVREDRSWAHVSIRSGVVGSEKMFLIWICDNFGVQVLIGLRWWKRVVEHMENR